ncbi:MAG: sulfotransferase domain-containing protein [Pseudomonadota bacterium]
MKKEFISYPKSGRTWIRYILLQLGLENDIWFHHSNFEFNDGNMPAHNFNIEELRHKYSNTDRIIYLERDPRDVMVSLFCQVTGRFKDFFNYQGSISDFIRDDYFGAESLNLFRIMWNNLAKEKGFLKVSYEECHEDMLKVISSILNYYNVDIEQGKLIRAIKNAGFDNMKNIELKNTFNRAWLQPRQGHLKVRKGKINGYKDSLVEADILFLNGIFKLH